MRSIQRLHKIPVRTLPLIIAASVVLILIVIVPFKLAQMSMRVAELRHCSHPVSTGPVPDDVYFALLHFASSPNASQQSKQEIFTSLNVLMERGPCNFLVFGVWFESLMWATFNYGGKTVFLEESREWVLKARKEHPQLEVHKVNYGTNLGEASNLLLMSRKLRYSGCRADAPLFDSTCPLALSARQGVPQEVLDEEWDVIMIDGPRSFPKDSTFPGRMSAIFTSAVMAKARKSPGYVDIFVHDVSRPTESQFSKEFLCMENLVKSVGDLWHFRVYPGVSPDFCEA